MPTTTPAAITPAILRFCKSISSATPIMIPVYPAEKTFIGECFRNVDAVVEERGGEKVLGWNIWERRGAFLEAEHHAVRRNLDGNLIDVTRHADGEKQIVFLQDDTAVPLEHTGLPNKMVATVTTPLVRRYVAAANVVRAHNWKFRSTLMLPTGQAYRDAETAAREFSALQSQINRKYP